MQLLCRPANGSISNFHLGLQSGGLGYVSSPVGSRGKAPTVGVGDKVPQKLKQFVNIVYRFQLQKQ